MKKVLIVLTSHDRLGDTGNPTGFYLPEVSHPVVVFERAGFAVDYVSPKGGKAPMIGIDLNDPLNKAFVEDEAKMAQVNNTFAPSQVNPADYDAIFFAGGHGTMWDFPDNQQLAAISTTIYEQGGTVAAVCHGPAALVNIRLSNGEYLIAGKTVSAFTNEEEAAVELTEVVPFLLETALTERGAQHTKAPKFETHTAVSDRIVTGQNPASATQVAEQIVQLIEQKALATG
jgi:putative intracellular protease/amidase